jgi:CubicO group peptidase (beta-lactamase class C family)
MGRVLRYIGIAAIAMVAWAAFVIAGTLDGWWKRPLAAPDDADAFVTALRAEIAAKSRGNVALRLIEASRPYDVVASVGAPVDAETLFQVASLSKWITAWGVMRLVEEGRLDLDAPVGTYLTRWSLPESGFDESSVTIRRLLSHTAGLTDGLGYGGFAAASEVQSLEDSLTQAADADEGTDGRVRIGIEPGSEWRYSGGGYTLLQLVVEEVTGERFADFMQHAILHPLGMARSTFDADAVSANLATFYDADGRPTDHRRFTALAAASLYTNVDDLTRFVRAHVRGPNGEPPGRGVLAPETLERMREPHAHQFGAAIWGLGTILYVPNGHDDFVIGHDGNNSPAINTAARVDPATGDAIIVLESGNRLLATELAGEWTFWKTGALDLLSVVTETPRMIGMVLVGWVLVVVAAIVVARRRRG